LRVKICQLITVLLTKKLSQAKIKDMELVWAIAIFIVGMVLIIKGGDWFVDSATWIAKAAKIPSFIIGATIVGLATSLPELIVSIVASVQGKNDMAVGNAVGSVIANTGLILAIALTFMNLTTPRKDYWQQCLLLVACIATLWLGSFTGTLSIWASIIMLLFCIAFIAVSIIQGRRGEATATNTNTQIDVQNAIAVNTTPETAAIEEKIITETLSSEENSSAHKKTKDEPMFINKKTVFKNIFFFFLGAACVIFGSDLLIDGGSTIATALHIPERIIAITLVAVGTSLPELVTTIVAIRKKEGSLMAGNIIGSNIIDICLILPICSFVAHDSFAVSQQTILIDMPFLLGFSILAFVPMIWKQRSYKWQGILLLIGYVAYLTLSAVL